MDIHDSLSAPEMVSSGRRKLPALVVFLRTAAPSNPVAPLSATR
jgi:hypothetical protein